VESRGHVSLQVPRYWWWVAVRPVLASPVTSHSAASASPSSIVTGPGCGTSGRPHGLPHSSARYAESDLISAEECIEENRILILIHTRMYRSVLQTEEDVYRTHRHGSPRWLGSGGSLRSSASGLRCLPRPPSPSQRPLPVPPTSDVSPAETGGTERGWPFDPARTKQAPHRSEERSESRTGERPGAFNPGSVAGNSLPLLLSKVLPATASGTPAGCSAYSQTTTRRISRRNSTPVRWPASRPRRWTSRQSKNSFRPSRTDRTSDPRPGRGHLRPGGVPAVLPVPDRLTDR
jgi:hypothetical protein